MELETLFPQVSFTPTSQGTEFQKPRSVACVLGTYVASKPGSVPEYSKELIEELKAEGLNRNLIKSLSKSQ